MEIIKIVLLIVVSASASIFTFYTRAYATKLIQNISSVELANLIAEGTEVILRSVNYVQQTYVDALKREQKFDKEAQKRAFALAKEKAVELMNEETQKAIIRMYGNLDTYIEVIVESAVQQNKQEQKE